MAAPTGPFPHDDEPALLPTAECVLTMRIESGRLLVSVLLNPDVRSRAGERRFRPRGLEEAILLVRDTADRLHDDGCGGSAWRCGSASDAKLRF
ncbi:hypothetical protein [Actinoplanes sp. DH11]|uniref:hypothetical protein n=1 Tax=Actinoplanes sp. DH11 TaxID=2857011 RepID=UPI001E398767|nr:hypothetical protein [Actinoplanes sp. DH11]